MIVMETPGVAGIDPVVEALREWQSDDAPLQLHPGDLGWYWRHGAENTAASLRVWRRDGEIVAIGLIDGPELFRMTLAPGLHRNEELSRVIADDVDDPSRGILPEGEVSVEAPNGSLVQDLLRVSDWAPGESWTLSRRELADPVETSRIAIEIVGEDASDLRASTAGSNRSTAFQADRWRALAAQIPFADARCLIAHDDAGEAVGVITVWSAGRGRPGLVAPLGVAPEHRGHGYGKAIVLAGARVLRDFGSSSVLVANQTMNMGAAATYASAGFETGAERRDLTRRA